MTRYLILFTLLFSTIVSFAQKSVTDTIAYGNNASAGGIVKLKNVELYYEIYGKGEPLLLLHGGRQSIAAYKKHIKAFSEKYRVIAVDTRAQGKSKDFSSGPLSYNLFAEDMKSLLDSLHIARTDILGWSDGGNTGLTMAVKYPSYVHKLAIMGSNTTPTIQAVPAELIQQVHEAIDKLKLNTDEQSKTNVRLLTMLVTEPNISTENLESIKAPVLVMAGQKDVILDKHTRYIAQSIPKSQLYIFKGATHLAPFEVAPEFTARVLKFFDEK